MIKKDAQEMSFEDFCGAISQKMLNELAKMNISYARAYNIFKDTVKESKFAYNYDIGTMDSIVRNIILDYTEDAFNDKY